VAWGEGVRVVEFCDSRQRYQIGTFTSASAAAAFQVGRSLAADPAPLLVQVSGLPSSLPSGWPASPDVVGFLSVGYISVAGRGACA
jgi:hypothetical protein